MSKPIAGQVMLGIAILLAAVIGGNFPTDATQLSPDSLWQNLLAGNPALFCSGLVALLACGALVYALSTRRVIQVPFQQTLFVCVFFVAAILISMMFSSYRWPAMYTSLQWMTYVIAMGAAAALAGRQQGAIGILGALTVGCTIVSLQGVLEYAGMRAIDPNWRIFASWMNPNALAGMLLLGFFSALGLLSALKRVQSLLAGIAATFIGVAILLTQSKGGLLAMGVGIVGFAALTLGWTWTHPPRLKRFAPIAVVLVVVVAFTSLLQMTASRPADSQGGSMLGRVSAAGAQSGQSSGFRKQLWKGSIELMKQNPLGTGGGSYQFVSTKPGLTTATPVAHQSFLQIGVEFGVLALAAFLALGALWFRDMFRGARKLPPEQNILRAGVVAAVLASGVHSLIDSDLSYYGSGLAFFVLLGVGLQLCADGVTPEAIPKGPRIMGILTATVVPLALLWFGYQEALQAGVRGAIAEQKYEAALKGVEGLEQSASADGETWYLKGFVSRNVKDRVEAFQAAADLSPWPKYYRALARAQAEAGTPAGAVSSLEQALRVDPNNMLALKQLIDVHLMMGNPREAKIAAQRLVDVEKSTYYTVRAIPEDIPTETFEARLYLAKTESDPRKQIEYLSPAMEGFRRYIGNTLPNILQGRFPGETKDSARAALFKAQEIADILVQASQEVRDDVTLKDAGTFQEEVLKGLATTE
ncbi:MAG: O-antigen ligase family protein [Fimbriimonadaceae bacterium]|nr:O-antigen ligase family protein [Fimbriimonadaceae bacterium]